MSDEHLTVSIPVPWSKDQAALRAHSLPALILLCCLVALIVVRGVAHHETGVAEQAITENVSTHSVLVLQPPRHHYNRHHRRPAHQARTERKLALDSAQSSAN